jgi:transcription antitermination factor NusG
MQIPSFNPETEQVRQEHWYALHTRHQHEKTIAAYLSTCGFETFLPLHDSVHQWKDRAKRISLPLFPSYVFLHSSLSRRGAILSTPGVYAIVGIANRPAAIPEAEIAAIRAAVNSSLIVEPHPFLRCGDRVRIRTGALAGIEGFLLRHKNIYRLVISATLLGKSIAVEVDTQRVERVALTAVTVRPVEIAGKPWVPETGIESKPF